MTRWKSRRLRDPERAERAERADEIDRRLAAVTQELADANRDVQRKALELVTHARRIEQKEGDGR